MTPSEGFAMRGTILCQGRCWGRGAGTNSTTNSAQEPTQLPVLYQQPLQQQQLVSKRENPGQVKLFSTLPLNPNSQWSV